MSEVYSILNVELFAQSMRKNVALGFSKDQQENLDDLISLNQITTMIRNHSVGFDEENKYLIDEEGYNNIFEETREWIYQVGLCRLASRGDLECAWDSNLNEMVFWPTESVLEKLSNYETDTNKSNRDTKK